MLARYDSRNPAALRRLIASGVQLRQWPRPVLEASYAAANQVYAETSAKNAKFKAVYEPWKTFRDEQIRWFGVAEAGFDSFMASTLRTAAPAKAAPAAAPKK
jgi:TRAP-type mannitol/chloroaromatic compound transport system substrate-binding protein